MTTSGTTNFNPTMGEAVMHAFQMCGVRPTALTQEHMTSARMAANLLMTTWSSKGVNLWKVTLQSVPLVAGQASYRIPANNIVMLDTYIHTEQGSSATDRLILPVSRSEYASYPNKAQQGFPTVYWQDRLLNGLVYLWPVPDGSQTSLDYYQVEQIEDANYTGGQTLDLPTYFLEAFVNGMAYRLAIMWAPERAQALKLLADESYQTAADQNIETANFYVSPQVGGYWRN